MEEHPNGRAFIEITKQELLENNRIHYPLCWDMVTYPC